MRCDSCEALMIQGVFCHETGCPNVNKRYDADSDIWVAVRKCGECGGTVDADDECCGAPTYDDDIQHTLDCHNHPDYKGEDFGECDC